MSVPGSATGKYTTTGIDTTVFWYCMSILYSEVESEIARHKKPL